MHRNTLTEKQVWPLRPRRTSRMSTRVAVWLTDLESEVIYHLPCVFPPLVIVNVRIRLLPSLDRCRRDVSSWSGGSFSGRLLDRLRLIVYCSMCFEWSWQFVLFDVTRVVWVVHVNVDVLFGSLVLVLFPTVGRIVTFVSCRHISLKRDRCIDHSQRPPPWWGLEAGNTTPPAHLSSLKKGLCARCRRTWTKCSSPIGEMKRLGWHVVVMICVYCCSYSLSPTSLFLSSHLCL